MVVPAGRARQSSRPNGGVAAAAAAAAAGGLTSEAEALLSKLLAVQRDLPPAQAVAIAARTGCTAEAALEFWQERQDALARCLRQARERAAAEAAAAAAEGRPTFIVPETEAEVQALIASAASARQAATAKLRALQDAAGKGLRDAGVTGQFVSLMASLTSAVVRCRACAAITTSSKLIRRKLVAAAGFLTTLEDWMVAAVAAEHITLLLEALAALEALPLEAPLLRSTGCAGLLRMVRQLAKHFRTDVAAAAGQLGSRWQAVLQGGPARLSTSSGQPAVKQETPAEQQAQQQQAQQAQQAQQVQQPQAEQQADEPRPKRVRRLSLKSPVEQPEQPEQQAQQAQQPQQLQAQQLADETRPEQVIKLGVKSLQVEQQQQEPQQEPQQAQRAQQPQQQQQTWQPPPAFDPPACKRPVAFGEDSTEAAATAAARKAGRAPAEADSAAGEEDLAAVPALPYVDLALKERPLFKTIVRTLHAAKKGGSGVPAGTAGTAGAEGTVGAAGQASTAGTAGGTATPAAVGGRAVQTPPSAPAGTAGAAGGSSAPLASARSSAAAAAAVAAAGGTAAESGVSKRAAPLESSQAADVKAQPSGKAVSAGKPPQPQQQAQTAGSTKCLRTEGEPSGGGRAGQAPAAKRHQGQSPQGANRAQQGAQQQQQGAQQPQVQQVQQVLQPQPQVQWQPPPAFDLPVSDDTGDPVAFGEDSTEVAAMAAARTLGPAVPDADEGPAAQVEQAAVPDLPYEPSDAEDAQEQEQALRKAGWRPPA